jgi:DNA-binding IclR family transcriptional regulator
VAAKTGTRRGEDSGPAPVQAVSRALAILGQFTGQDSALSLAELARRTGLHRTTAYRLIRTLETEGFLAHDAATGAYRVGLAWAASLTSLSAHPVLTDIINEDLQKLADSTGEGATLSIRRGEQVQIFRALSTYDLFEPVRPPSELVPMSEYWNVHSRIHLAYASKEVRERMTAVRAVRYTDTTVTDKAEIVAGLARTLEEKFAASYEERRPGVAPIAVPVFSNGSLAATVGLVVPVERYDEEHLNRYTRALRETAAAMGRRMEHGFMPTSAPQEAT